MTYTQQQAPANLDTDGVRRFTEEQLRQVSRATAQMAQDHDSLAADVVTNTANIATNTANIVTNTAGIATNAGNIATNTANIAALATTVLGAISTTLTTSATAQNVGSILIPVGTWDVSALVQFDAGGGATNGTDWASILSLTSTPSTASGNSIIGVRTHERRPAGLDYALTQYHLPYKLVLASPATLYVHAQATWSVAPAFNVGGFIRAIKWKP